MEKRPFVSLEQIQEMAEKFPTPFHLYDEKGIRENAQALKEAFAWNPGYKNICSKGYAEPLSDSNFAGVRLRL